MLALKCRLCSSDCALISLSGGKCRKNRDYIRKLVEATTGIKFQKHDLYKYVCYPCTVQVYNFYIFKVRSLENEATLEAHVTKDDMKKIKSNKIEILDLSSIALPEIKVLENTLVPWLLSKSKYGQSSSESKKDENKEKHTEHNGIADNMHQNEINESTKAVGIDISIQCDLVKNTSDKGTQIDPPKNISSHNKFTQCRIPNIAVYTQTNGVLTESTEIQCYLLEDNWEKQPKSKTVDTAIQCYDTCSICQEIDCKCYMHDLVNIKQEPQSSTPLIDLSPVNSFTISPIKNVLPLTPTDNSYSPTLNVSENAITCRMCRKTLPSKESYKQHKKNHMRCSFCKKKFTSMKRSKYHIENDCIIKKKIDTPTVVELVKVENLKETQMHYSKCLEDLKSWDASENCKTHFPMRMRSRSTSSVDSFGSCYSSCNYPVTILHGLKLGVDKSVQTNFFENSVVSALLTKETTSKPKFKIMEDLMSPAKKIKLSSSLIG